MTWLPAALPDALLFACFGFVVALAALGIVVGWLGRFVWAALGRFDFRGRVWSPLLGAPRTSPRLAPTRVPAAPQLFKPLPRRMTGDRIHTELARIEAEILTDLGPDFAQILGLFADDPHTTDH